MDAKRSAAMRRVALCTVHSDVVCITTTALRLIPTQKMSITAVVQQLLHFSLLYISHHADVGAGPEVGTNVNSLPVDLAGDLGRSVLQPGDLADELTQVDQLLLLPIAFVPQRHTLSLHGATKSGENDIEDIPVSGQDTKSRIETRKIGDKDERTKFLHYITPIISRSRRQAFCMLGQITTSHIQSQALKHDNYCDISRALCANM